MRVRKQIIWISLILILFLIFLLAYPLYVHWIAGHYAKQFGIILDLHDMQKYDSFFDEDTLFVWNGKQILYSDARNNMNQLKSFTSAGAYGHLDEDTNVYTDREYVVSLMLPISDFDEGAATREPGILEGEFIIQRKWLFFFRIKQVYFFDDKEGFLDRFLGGNERETQ